MVRVLIRATSKFTSITEASDHFDLVIVQLIQKAQHSLHHDQLHLSARAKGLDKQYSLVCYKACFTN